MNLKQLQYFRVLAKTEHYTKAAEKLYITQPSLSYSISELEKEFDTQLFEKEGRNVKLTKYGRVFFFFFLKKKP
jgi:DNA-binding transcriptional LysR family regulator